jgi:hypothetical protein
MEQVFSIILYRLVAKETNIEVRRIFVFERWKFVMLKSCMRNMVGNGMIQCQCLESRKICKSIYYLKHSFLLKTIMMLLLQASIFNCYSTIWKEEKNVTLIMSSNISIIERIVWKMTSYTHKRSHYYGRKILTGKVVGRYF